MALTLTLMGLGCATAIAACGGSGGAGTGSRGSYSAALKFSQCMRAHGLSNFPDPGGPGGPIQLGGKANLNPQSPSFQAAQKACAKYAPFKGGPPKMTEAQRVAAFKLAKCIRSHGYPNFPDPSLSVPSGLGHGLVAVLDLRGMVFAFNSSFDPRSPAFRLAANHCGLHLPSGPRPEAKISSAP